MMKKLITLTKNFKLKLISFMQKFSIYTRFQIIYTGVILKYNRFREFIISFYNKLNIFKKTNSNINEKINTNKIDTINNVGKIDSNINETYIVKESEKRQPIKNISSRELSKKDLENIKRITSENNEFLNVSKKVNKYKKKEIFEMLQKNSSPKESLFILFIIALGMFYFFNDLAYDRQLYFPGDSDISGLMRNKTILKISMFFLYIGLFIPIIFSFKKHVNPKDIYTRLAVNYINKPSLVRLLEFIINFSYCFVMLIISTKFIKYSLLTIYHSQPSWIPYGSNFVYLGAYVSFKYIFIIQFFVVLFYYISINLFIKQNRYFGIGIFFIRLSTAFVTIIVFIFAYEAYTVNAIIHADIPGVVKAVHSLYYLGLGDVLYMNYHINASLVEECFDSRRKLKLERLIKDTLTAHYATFGCFLFYFLTLEYYASIM